MFEKDAEEIAKDIYMHHFDDDVNYPDVLRAITVGVQKGAEFDERQSEKKIEELEEKISVLLSCKNCPENKGGLICAKEYENKCLAQKIQHIKELQEENAELKAEIENDRDLPTVAYMQGAEKQKKKDEKQLTKAKEIIKDLCVMVRELNKPNVQLTNVDYSLSNAEQFIKE